MPALSVHHAARRGGCGLRPQARASVYDRRDDSRPAGLGGLAVRALPRRFGAARKAGSSLRFRLARLVYQKSAMIEALA